MKKLEENFYPRNKWFESMLNFYSNKKNMPSREILSPPIGDIADSMHTMCVSYDVFPEDLAEFLELMNNPLMDYDNFVEKIVKRLHGAKEESGEVFYSDMANALHFTRLLIEKDLKTCKERGYGDEKILPELSTSLSIITKSHANQLARLIRKTYSEGNA